MEFICDFRQPGAAPRRRVYRRPQARITAWRPGEVADALREVQTAWSTGHHLAGMLSYEAAAGLDPACVVHPAAHPAAHLAAYPAVHPAAPTHMPPSVRAGARIPLIDFGVFDAPLELSAPACAASLTDPPPWQADAGGPLFRGRVQAVRAAIARGEVYQVNLSLRLQARWTGDPLVLYENLRLAQQADCCAWADLGDLQVLSASPERFFDLQGGLITCRPMKGTAPRSADPGQDRALAAALLASDKDRAENLMIVDLVRNDLARLSVPGGVTVPELFRVEHFPTLHQLTSTVQARLRPGVDLLQIMAALFPGGSVTGAPKFRAMAQIAALEDSPRGPYCGTLGVLAPGGVAQFNLAIRTAWHDPAAGRLTCGLGAGITWPSDPEAEYRETLLKGRFLGLEPPATGAGAGEGD